MCHAGQRCKFVLNILCIGNLLITGYASVSWKLKSSLQIFYFISNVQACMKTTAATLVSVHW